MWCIWSVTICVSLYRLLPRDHVAWVQHTYMIPTLLSFGDVKCNLYPYLSLLLTLFRYQKWYMEEYICKRFISIHNRFYHKQNKTKQHSLYIYHIFQIARKPSIDCEWTSIRHVRVGSMSNRCQSEGLCYHGWGVHCYDSWPSFARTLWRSQCAATHSIRRRWSR